MRSHRSQGTPGGLQPWPKLGLGDWDAVERNLRDYITARGVRAFHIASTLRQLTEVWDLDASDERGRGLVETLRAQLLRLFGGAMQLVPGELAKLRRQPAPDRGQLEAVLGLQGPETYCWWKTGLDRARSVVSIRRRLGDRIGTGFLIEAGAVNLEPSGDLLVMTNFHVINEFSASPGARPDEAEVMFEAEHPDQHYAIGEIVWTSPIARHDCTILRLEERVEGVPPMPLAKSLPVINETARVYIIGHPGGHELAFSFQDNEHEVGAVVGARMPGDLLGADRDRHRLHVALHQHVAMRVGDRDRVVGALVGASAWLEAFPGRLSQATNGVGGSPENAALSAASRAPIVPLAPRRAAL